MPVISDILISQQIAGNFEAYDYEAITVSNTAIGLTSTKVDPVLTASRHAANVLITTETNSVRYRYDGNDPTASEGHLLAAGSVITIRNQKAMDDIRFIRVTSDATLRVTYER